MAKVVDQYEIRNEKTGEFTNVILNLQMSDGSTEAYSFVPPFAHALSDELCKAAAMAGRKDAPAEG